MSPSRREVVVLYSASSEWARWVVSGLEEAGVEVIVFHPGADQWLPGRASGSGRRIRRLFAAFADLTSLRRRLRSSPSSHLLVLYGGYNAVLGHLGAGFAGSREFSVFLGGSDVYGLRGLSALVLKRCYSSAANLLVAGESMKSRLPAWPSVAVWHHGIDVNRIAAEVAVDRDRLDLPAGELRVLCLRKFEPVHNNEAVVEGLRIANSLGVKFSAIFAGYGPLLESCRLKSSRAGLPITFLEGYVPDELPELLAWANVIVSASFWDGRSTSLLEAMAAHCYLLVSDIEANRDVLGDGSDYPHMYFDPNRPRDLAECLLALESVARESGWPKEEAFHGLEKYDYRSAGAALAHLLCKTPEVT